MQDQYILLGLAAGAFQLLGYILYLGNRKIDPNPMTWFMFGYGTIILTVLEWDKNATFSELILPTVCSVLGIVVFIKCWWAAYKKSIESGKPHPWPPDLKPDGSFERISFIGDLLITVGYIGSWLLAASDLLDPASREVAVFTFLVLSNLSVILEFLPITKSTYQKPEREHYAPWLIWTIAYALLGLLTFMIHGFWTVLMLYPTINTATHGIIAALALRRRGNYTKRA